MPHTYKYFGLFILIASGGFIRCLNLGHPNGVVFDEVYYGSACSLYKNHQFFVDKHPPLFKILACSLMFEEHMTNSVIWSHIGNEFPKDFPISFVRMFPAILGVATIPATYYFVVSCGFSHFAATVSSLLVTFDNGLIVQCRILTSDSFQQCMLLIALCFANRNSLFGFALSFLCIGAVISTNTSLYYVWFMISYLALKRSTFYFADTNTSLEKCLIRGVLCISTSVIPILVYIFTIATHVSLLPSSGPHDNILSSSFQSSLLGNIHETNVTFGSFTYLHTTDETSLYVPCYLRSVFPLHSTSHNNNVSNFGEPNIMCNTFKDEQSIWQVTSCVNNTQLFEYEWQVILDENGPWINEISKVRFLHVKTQTFLTSTEKYLPNGVNKESEVACEEASLQNTACSTKWNSEVLHNFRGETRSKTFGLWQKIMEFHRKSLQVNSDSTVAHTFSSELVGWPLAQSNIAYWYNANINAQIHFVGNVVGWVGGVVSILFVLIFCFLNCVLRRRRICYTTEDYWEKILFQSLFLLSAWVMHLLVLYVEEASFIYEYAPAVVFTYVLQGVAFDVLHLHCGWFAYIIACLYTTAVIKCYWSLRSITFGFPLTSESLNNLFWWSSWEFLAV
uniref:protein O-mannosyl-transferase 1-like isoform X2 n=1 Tax=Ciona intestinalis TaxID=7719 RepID=UPI000EF4DB6A|nr:protein O-mannosyl-transferase 1-like isoform X2 [Ciona intestinalis]|eukprot:XP_026696306.1 protein O-mannosyl-transferase 1-like isoform X2 [Ciona intestinalis]